MKKHWTQDDIVAGTYLIRESSSKDNIDLGFARTVAYKIGWHLDQTGVYDRNGHVKQYCLISAFTDGMIEEPLTKPQLAKRLNNDKYGFRALTKEEVAELVADEMKLKG
jgi:hypothetical protein